MRILFLDDDDDLREAMSEYLEALGHEVVVVASVAELVALGATALACQLVILDVNLGADAPSGVDALHWLEDQGFAGRVVFLTGHTSAPGIVTGAVARSANRQVRVVEKPVTSDELEALLGAGAS